MGDDLVTIVFVCLLVPVVFLLAVLKDESRTVFGYMLIGVTIGLIASQVNTAILTAVGDYFYVTTNLTPVSEEILKALPVLFFTFAISRKAENIVPVATAVGIGFAVYENTTILLQAQNASLLWIFSRGIGAGLMHAICTSAVGLGMSIVGYRKRLFVPGTFSLLALAIIYHGVFNILVENPGWQYAGICLPIFTYIPFVLLFRRKSRREDSKTQPPFKS